MNVILCLAALFLYGLTAPGAFYRGGSLYYLNEGLYLTAYLSLALALFNIIPIPPLDGSKVLYSFISDRAYMQLMRYERYGMIALLALIVLSDFSGLDPLSRATGWVFEKLFVFADWGFALALRLM